MMFKTVRVEYAERSVVRVILARGEKHNALSAQMITELHQAADILTQNKQIRLVVLTGEGRSFCAGGDLQWMSEQANASRETRIGQARALALMLKAWYDLDKPLIGLVQGDAYGGGLGLLAVCDIVIANAQAKFGFLETRLGLIPATIAPYIVAKMGIGAARRVFLSARIFSACEAQQLGLVNVLGKDRGEIHQRLEEEIAAILATKPKAVAATKALLAAMEEKISPDTINFTIAALADIWQGEEAREGVADFLAKKR